MQCQCRALRARRGAGEALSRRAGETSSLHGRSQLRARQRPCQPELSPERSHCTAAFSAMAAGCSGSSGPRDCQLQCPPPAWASLRVKRPHSCRGRGGWPAASALLALQLFASPARLAAGSAHHREMDAVDCPAPTATAGTTSKPAQSAPAAAAVLAPPRVRVLQTVVGSGPFGERSRDAKFWTLAEHWPGLTLGPCEVPATRTDLDIGPGGLAFKIDSILSRAEADALAEASERMGYSRFAPAITTPPGMRQNKAAHWVRDLRKPSLLGGGLAPCPRGRRCTPQAASRTLPCPDTAALQGHPGLWHTEPAPARTVRCENRPGRALDRAARDCQALSSRCTSALCTCCPPPSAARRYMAGCRAPGTAYPPHAGFGLGRWCEWLRARDADPAAAA